MELKEIINGMIAGTGRPMSAEDIYKSMTDNGGEIQIEEIKLALKELSRDGRVIITRRGKAALPEQLGLIYGRIQGNGRGFGFFIPADGSGDLFIAAEDMNGALHGDTVWVRKLTGSPRGRNDRGAVEMVARRAGGRVIGTFEADNEYGGYVVPDDSRVAEDVLIPFSHTNGANHGDKVVAEITQYPGARRPMLGKIAEVLGRPGDKGIDMLSIIRRLELPDKFPDGAQRQAEGLKAPDADALTDRRDLRGALTITIDGADAKDLDDAVSLEMADGLYRLGVHIADVSHYVKRGSPIDVEAYKRGTSVYFPDRVLPMLPKELSNGLCSLNPDEDKLTLSCVMDIDSHGKVVHHNIAKSVIRSNYRMTYDEVNAIFAGDPDMAAKYSDIMPMLGEMRRLKDILKAKRQRRGAIDFDLPEADIHLDGNGRAVGVSLHVRGEANMMIEEFMLAANETVAREGVDKGLPLMYRVHEAPDPERIKELNTFLHTLGYGVGNAEKVQPADVRKMLLKAAGSSEERVINNVTLRAMTKAKYSPDCDGHFGLAAKYYCHFTSPIRRYPDLLVHRALNESLEGRLDEENLKRWKAYLPGASDQCSGREVTATEAERAADDLKKCEYMAQHIGEEYQGVISGVTQGGFFVELGNTVEGRVKVESLSGDRYEWDEKGYRLVGRFTGLQYRLGDEVKVRAVSADMETSRVEFELIEEKPHKAPRESPKRSGHGSTRGRNSDKIKALKSKKGGHGFGHSKRHQKGRGKSKGTP